MEAKEFVSRKPHKIRALLSSFLKKTDDERFPENTASEAATDSALDHSSSSPEKAKLTTIRPLNKEDYLKRIDSFSIFTWFAKPLELSPLECARYGWENIDVDTLRCVSCKAIMNGGLPHQWEKDLYAAACARVKDQLKSAHKSICPWPGSPTPESYTSVSTTNMKELIRDFQGRAKELQDCLKQMPEVEFSFLENKNRECDRILESLRKMIVDKKEARQGESIEQRSITALVALFAWKKCTQEFPVVKCEYCGRQVGLWNFSSKASNQAEEEDSQPPIKKMKHSSFNPAKEHRPWCPWICKRGSQTQSPDAQEAPWETLLEALLKMADSEEFDPSSPLSEKKSTPPNQAWKTVRRIMSFWQSKETPVKTGGVVNVLS